jgi:hypothetical protein
MYVIECYGNGAFYCRGSIRRTDRYLARNSSEAVFIGPEPVLVIILCYVNLECCGLCLATTLQESICVILSHVGVGNNLICLLMF